MPNRREFLKRTAGMAMASWPAAAKEASAMSAPPNLIWIISDQHRAQATGCMGDPNVATPHLDRLAGGGFSAVAGCPLCTPFRGSMLTSRYPHECCPGHDHAMPDGMPGIGGVFRGAGYRTAYFGKWHVDGRDHIGPDKRSGKQFVRPERRGDFECWLGYENNNAQWDCWLHGHDEHGKEVGLYQLPKYETDALTDLLIGYIRNRAEESPARPFFAVVSVQPPHSPYKAPEEYMARHRPEDIQLRKNVPDVARVTEAARQDLAGYYAMIENLDWNVGRIMESLEAGGLLDNTYVVYFSDHGDMHGSHGRILKCVPWEESIRTPFFVSKGGQALAGNGRSPQQSLINHVDLAPTSLGLCGIAPPEWMRGGDFSPLFTGRASDFTPPDSAFLQLVDPGYKYGFAPDRERPWRGLVTDDGWKYAVFEGQPWCMYHLEEDPFELVNLAHDGRFRAQRRKLQDRLAQWIADTGDEFTLPEIWG